MTPDLDPIARRERAMMMLFAGAVCAMHYPLDVFVLDVVDTGPLRLTWTALFLLAAGATLRGSMPVVIAAAHGLGALSMVAILALAHLTDGPHGFQFWWLLVFPLLAALMAPEDWHATAATTVTGVLGLPLLFHAWDRPTDELMLAQLALVVTGALGIFACFRYTRQRAAERELVDRGEQLAAALSEAEARREQAEHELERQRLETVGSLTAGLTHDLNNTLGALLMNLEFVADDADALEDVSAAGRELRVLLGDLSQVARPKPGEATDLAEAIDSAVRLTQPQWRRKTRLQLDIPVGLPPVHGSTGHVVTALSALLLEAASRSSTEKPLRVRVTRSEGACEVHVALGRRAHDDVQLPLVRRAVATAGGALVFQRTSTGLHAVWSMPHAVPRLVEAS